MDHGLDVEGACAEAVTSSSDGTSLIWVGIVLILAQLEVLLRDLNKIYRSFRIFISQTAYIRHGAPTCEYLKQYTLSLDIHKTFRELPQRNVCKTYKVFEIGV